MHSVLILEDHVDSSEFIAQVVREAFPDTKLQFAHSINDAVALSSRYHFNLALVDLNLPDGSGVEFLHHLNQQSSVCISVIMTIYDDDFHLFQALCAGASGYLLKDSSKTQLVQALCGIVTGFPPLSSCIARRILRAFKQNPSSDNGKPLIQQLTTETNPSALNSRPSNDTKLTGRESDVLSLIAKGFSSAEIGRYLGITTHTSASHIKNIYRKLNVGSRAEAAILANQLGLS
ncbi:MAG: response regulator transcription factor [Undibacterium sp.]|nr:response regulator transcription factor [Undibacterium sp.]